MLKVCVFTGSRAEYGILRPLLRELAGDPAIDLGILVGGSHMASGYGDTMSEIEQDGFPVFDRIEMQLASDSPVGMAKSVGLGIVGLADSLRRIGPDCMVYLGDRYEGFAACSTCMFLNIPIVHFHGGEITVGAVDDSIRHCITKMAHLHFTSTEAYRQRVIQLGESPDRVFNIGFLGIEGIPLDELLSREELERELEMELDRELFLVTVHPSTRKPGAGRAECRATARALRLLLQREDLAVVITGANSDPEGRFINGYWERFVSMFPRRCRFVPSLGRIRFLSLLKITSVMIGNSSSAIFEAPMFRVPAINIGDRQKGRFRGENVVDCPGEVDSILEAVARVRGSSFQDRVRGMDNPFYQPGSSARAREIIKTADFPSIPRKEFQDFSTGGEE